MKNRPGTRIVILLVWLSCCLPILSMAQQNENAKPWVLWYWVKAGVSKAGITRDLEAMKANGLGGAYLVTIQGADKTPLYSPAAVQLTPEWWQLVEFAMHEAKRLNLKLGMHISDGFALAGGPWITPELSMQKVVWSSVTFTKPTGKIVLPQPETKENYYKDIAVYAYPSPVGTGVSTRTIQPVVTTSNGTDATGLIKPGNQQSFGANQPCYIQYAFDQPFTCRTVSIKVGGNNYQAQRLEIEVSNDGKIFRSIGRLQPPRHGWQDTDEDVTHSIVPTTARYFRFIYDKTASEPGAEDLDAAKWKPSLKILNLELFAEAKINQFEGKNGSVWRVSKRSSSTTLSKDLCVPLNKVVNLTGKLNPDGTLNWTPPSGSWTILRIGHTSTGHTNATGGGGKGLECDKFNPEAAKLQIKCWYAEALKHGGPDIAKKVLSVFYMDSWECGSQNWSPVFQEEFKKRRGYDITKYLPAITGLPIENASVAENFLYDVRKTISELLIDNFYGTLASFAKEQGLLFTAESVAPTMMSDGLLHYKTVDVPMGEFWLNSPTHDKPNDMLDAISAAHIYGKNIVQAEAFTTVRMDWNEHPANMKTVQDRNYALGVNKLVYHVFTHNPWTDRKPGMTLDGVGLYFQRDQTWWKPGKAWVDYAIRCQDLLQQGKPVTDIAVFTGEELPRRSVLPDRLVQTLPGIFGKDVVAAERKRLANAGEPLRQIPSGVTHSANMADPENWVNPLRGYAYDSFNPDVLSTATVKDGAVVFESGASYQILVFTGKISLNPNYQYISFETVKKLYELINKGAKVIIAERPLYQPGLQQANVDEFSRYVEAIWGGAFRSVGKQKGVIAAKRLGQGMIYKAPFYGEDFSALYIERDLVVTEKAAGNGVHQLPGFSSQPDNQHGSNLSIAQYTRLQNHQYAKPDKFNDRQDAAPYAKNIAFTHRTAKDKEVYFIANQLDKVRELTFRFRAQAAQPVIYDPVTNDTVAVGSWSTIDGRTTMVLQFNPNQSLFVIFKKPTYEKITFQKATGQKITYIKPSNSRVIFQKSDFTQSPSKNPAHEKQLHGKPAHKSLTHEKLIHQNSNRNRLTDEKACFAYNSDYQKQPLQPKRANGNNWSTFKTIQDISADWEAQFDTSYGGPSKPVLYPHLLDWTKSTDTLVKYYSGTAIYTKTFNFEGTPGTKIWIDLGEFYNLANVKINGIDCGTLWTAPHRLDISNTIKKGKNQITVEIVNTWGNRLIGDSRLPAEQRLTQTTAPFRLAGKPLYPAGLVGPVTIKSEED